MKIIFSSFLLLVICAAPAMSQDSGDLKPTDKKTNENFQAQPFKVEINMIDLENGDSVIGADFSFRKVIKSIPGANSPEKLRGSNYALDFLLKGTATLNAEENPRNFIETKLSGFYSSFRTKYYNAAIVNDEDDPCASSDQNDFPNCTADAIRQTQINKVGGTVFNYLAGVNLGYESDQKFEAKNSVIGLNAVFHLKKIDNSFWAKNEIVTTVMLALDDISPNADTPRAQAGDDSNFQRASGELAISFSLANLVGKPYKFTYSYRYFEELSPSEIVQNANLDTNHLITYSILSPTGIVFSYSSGKLPFDVSSDNTVELGYQFEF
ncbi:hypothetical protein MN202_00780 [Rheinheimera muenzenbergensis]|uniref:MetA-pathway of phenol degradation n=1 Tax=Rheinheimera muenzenbergensis TaxID=1193628 RepID=A0ABU8C1H6_9GAMM